MTKIKTDSVDFQSACEAIFRQPGFIRWIRFSAIVENNAELPL